MNRYLFLMAALLLLLGTNQVYAARWIVGIAISNSDRTYVWFSDGVVVSGTTTNFESENHAEPFTLPRGRTPADIVAIAIAKSNDHVFTWYRDGKVSVGTSKDLARHVTPRSYTIAPGKSVVNIAGIGIGGDDRVNTWYRDGTVSVGTSLDLDHYQAPSPFTLPADMTPDDITEVDINGSDGHVYAWYRTGLVTAGTVSDLDHYQAPLGYLPGQVIYHWWGPRFGKQPSVVAAESNELLPLDKEEESEPAFGFGKKGGSRPGMVESSDFGMANVSPAPSIGPFVAPYSGGTIDPMIAVGNQFIIVSDTSKIAFMDRQGNLLPSKNGLPSTMTTSTFFDGFVAETNADGSFNDRNINRYLGYPKLCNSPDYPETITGKGFCVTSFYDTRVHFDPVSRRFFIMSNSRGGLGEEKTAETGFCMSYSAPPVTDTSPCLNKDDPDSIDDRCKRGSNEYCDLVRRLVAFAVSKTEDPRDGFYQYIMTANEYRDWPWMAVNRGHFTVAHHGLVNARFPAITVFSTNAVALGNEHPPYFRYSNRALVGRRLLPPRQYGPAGDPSFLLSATGEGRLDIFAFPQSADPWTTPTPLHTSVEMGDQLVPSLLNTVYRNQRLYFVGSKKIEDGNRTRSSVRLVRLPVTLSPTSISVSTDAATGFLDWFFGLNAFGDPAGSRINYKDPSIAVNARGDMLFAYYRESFAGPALFSEARYSLWRNGEPKQRRSRLLKAGEAEVSDTIDYTTAVVDPADDRSFWIALPYAKAAGRSGSYKPVFGKVSP